MTRTKRLLFFTSFDYPARYAHPIHALFMSRAFAGIFGDEFLLILNAVKDPELLSGIPHHLALGRFGRRIKLLRLRTPAYVLWFFFFMLSHRKWRSEGTVVFVNDPRLGSIAALFRPLFGYRIVFESHTRLVGPLSRFVLRKAYVLVFVTEALRIWTIAQYPTIRDKSIVARNAVDVARFEAVTETISELREGFLLPKDACMIGYLGRFTPGGIDKGVSFMLKCLRTMPSEVHMLFVGGTAAELVNAQALAEREGVQARTHFVAHVPSEHIARYAKACDILAYVPAPTGERGFFETETSPMKVFEYMAARRPCIVSDLPTTREILDEDSAWFIRPGSAEAFVRAVRDIKEKPNEADERATRAFSRVADNTWESRAARIVQALDGAPSSN